MSSFRDPKTKLHLHIEELKFKIADLSLITITEASCQIEIANINLPSFNFIVTEIG